MTSTRPDAVRFTGPVEAVNLMPDSVDPQGMNIDARQLEMKRQPATGRVASVEGEDMSVDWPLGAKAGRVNSTSCARPASRATQRL